MVTPPTYVTASDERKVLGVKLLVGAVSLFMATYVCQCVGFLIFLFALAGALVLFLPVHKNVMRLEGRSVLVTGCDTGQCSPSCAFFHSSLIFVRSYLSANSVGVPSNPFFYRSVVCKKMLPICFFFVE